MKKVKLPSGRELTITDAPFDDAKELFQIVMGEFKGIHLDFKGEADFNFFKEMFLYAASSKQIEAAIWKCMERCLYKGTKITKEVFEDIEARTDYIDILVEVGRENLYPFTKNLSARLSQLMNSALALSQE